MKTYQIFSFKDLRAQRVPTKGTCSATFHNIRCIGNFDSRSICQIKVLYYLSKGDNLPCIDNIYVGVTYRIYTC